MKSTIVLAVGVAAFAGCVTRESKLTETSKQKVSSAVVGKPTGGHDRVFNIQTGDFEEVAAIDRPSPRTSGLD